MTAGIPPGWGTTRSYSDTQIAADCLLHARQFGLIVGKDAKSFMIGDFLLSWTKKDATWNPRPSGLLGPVRLTPMKGT